MPSTSKKQAKYMTANCKSDKFRRKTGMKKKVACDFHNADKGKYHEDETMSDDTLNEKVKLQHALKTEEGEDTEQHGNDVARMMKLAGIHKRLDANQEEGNVNFDGVFTGVANGSIPVGEGEYSFLKSLNENKGCDNPDCHCANCPGAGKCACGATNESKEEVDEAKGADSEKVDENKKEKGEYYADEEDGAYHVFHSETGKSHASFMDKSKAEEQAKEMNEAKSEEVDEAKGEEIVEADDGSAERKGGKRAAGSWGKPKKSGKTDAAKYTRREGKKKAKDEELDEVNRLRELSGIPQPQVNEYPDAEHDVVRFSINDEHAHEAVMARFGEEIQHEGDEMLIPEHLWGKVQEVAYLNGGEAAEMSDDMDYEMSGPNDSSDDAEALGSAGMGTDEYYGGDQYGESEMFSKGSLSRHMIEMIVDEMNKGKKAEEISEELSFDSGDVAEIVEFVKEACGKKHKKNMYKEADDKSSDVEMDDEEAKDEHPHKPYDKDYDGDHDHKDHDIKAVDEQISEMPMHHDDDEGDGYPLVYLSQEACREASGMFLDAVTGKLGGAMGEQAKSICRDGKPMEEQNPAALQYIEDYAAGAGLETLAREISDFLHLMKTGRSSAGEMDEETARMMELSGINEKKSGYKKH